LITTRRKTEKNTKKGKNLLALTYRPKGPKEREKMYQMTTAAEKAHSQTLKPYADKEDELGKTLLLAKKYGKKSEIAQARKDYENALNIVLAVDEALSNFRDNLEAQEK
jgi:endo-alpha-1,4-polygalactosaminidase (GH114 family)